VVSLFADPQTRYKKIIIKHDDHSDIIHDVINVGGWMTYNYTITIQDVILAMIETGEINKMCDPTEKVPPKCNETESKDGLHDQVKDDVVLDCSASEDKEEYLLDEYESEGEEDDSSKESESNVHCFQPNNSFGTVCTVEDVIKGCIFNAASCAMRYNKKSLREFGGKFCAAATIDGCIDWNCTSDSTLLITQQIIRCQFVFPTDCIPSSRASSPNYHISL
jgi:hypothetical protein